MGKSTKPRKPYKPMRQRMPIIYGMGSEVKSELAIAPLMSINMFMSGHGSEEHAYTIINAILTGYELVENADDFRTMIGGSDAIRRVIERGAEGKWGFSGDDLRDITAAVTLSDQMQAVATRRQLRGAVQAVLANADTYQT